MVGLSQFIWRPITGQIQTANSSKDHPMFLLTGITHDEWIRLDTIC